MIVLGIETTCDETAAAIVRNGEEILSNIIFSQAANHREFGGVFPELASRLHIEKIIPVMETSLKDAHVSLDEIDLIAAAKGPGLLGSILIGLNCAKALALAKDKPFLGINHVEAHLYAAMMQNEKKFPALGVVISGGHTMLLIIETIGIYKPLGSTIDDAMGEAFDKVASILDLPYPGGPEIEKIAKMGDPEKFKIRPAKVKERPLDFSFSGIKTKLLYLAKGQGANRLSPSIISNEEKYNLAAAFQKTIFDDLIDKVLLAIEKFDCQAVYVGGGVSNNQTLKELFNKKCPISFFFPKKTLSLDNAAMIAGLAYWKYKEKEISDSLGIAAEARISFS